LCTTRRIIVEGAKLLAIELEWAGAGIEPRPTSPLGRATRDLFYDGCTKMKFEYLIDLTLLEGRFLRKSIIQCHWLETETADQRAGVTM
jgi:hypothetical protein